ncbi:MAG: RnfH family protein [Pseudomonadota bacterium]
MALPDGATVAEALAAARAQSVAIEVPWGADVGIFGELCEATAVPRDGDRIELYRPLKSDPKVSRRERERARRVAQDRASNRQR